MAYVDQSAGRNQRATVMVAVALLQGAAFIALVNGLTVHFTKAPPVPNPVGQQIDMPLPPPPPLPDQQNDEVKTVQDRTTTQTNTTIDDGQNRYRPPETSTGGSENTGQTTTIEPQPQPQPPPPLPPAAARPMGRAGEWVTTNDYPSRDLREGNQGATSFRLAIGTDGRVQSCTITRSSGFRGLDDATCRNLTRRARFKPATDGSGNPVTGEYSNTIRWVIPD